MNYIKQLQQELTDEQLNRASAIDLINAHLRYLSSEKFRGFENNYINAQEVASMMLHLREHLQNV